MRVKTIETTNFAGLGSIRLEDLDSHTELYVGGKNGLGKSQLLLVIALVSRVDYFGEQLTKFIHSDANSAEVVVDFSLEDSEVERINMLLIEYGFAEPMDGKVLRARLELSRTREPQRSWQDLSGTASFEHIFESEVARESLAFADVVYLPADRFVERSPELTLALTTLSRASDRERGQEIMMQQISDWQGGYSGFDVFSSLAALHYAGLLQQHAGGGLSQQSTDFREITEAFQRATGKRILDPRLTSDGSISLEVQLPNGTTHPVNLLSSGELVALQLLHFIKMHYYRGAILLVDEPEQHLHPSLQLEIANAIRGGEGTGQVWIVTHSPNILNAVSGDDTIVLSRDRETQAVEGRFADSRPAQMSLLEELGVAPGLWVPGNFIAIVEGPTDVSFLRMLLPEEFSSAFFVVAGNSASVKSFNDKMKDSNELPYLAIRDRDGASEEEREKWNSDEHCFMWSGYAVESLFLDPDWIAASFRLVYPDYSEESVRNALDSAFDKQRDDMRKRWLDKEVLVQIPSKDDHRLPLSTQFKNAAEVATARAKFVEDRLSNLEARFDQLWESNPLPYADPKRANGEFKDPVFRDKSMRIQAMITQLTQHPELCPDDLKDLRKRLQQLQR